MQARPPCWQSRISFWQLRIVSNPVLYVECARLNLLVLARAVGGGGEHEGNLSKVEIVELDGATAVLVEAAGVVNGDRFTAAVVARVVVAELGVGGGLGNAEEGGNGTDDDGGLHSIVDR